MWLQKRPAKLTQTSKANCSRFAGFSYATSHHHPSFPPFLFHDVSTYKECLPSKPHHVSLSQASPSPPLLNFFPYSFFPLQKLFTTPLFSSSFRTPFLTHVTDHLSSREESRYSDQVKAFDSQKMQEVMSSAQRPHRVWYPPNLLFDGHRC